MAFLLDLIPDGLWSRALITSICLLLYPVGYCIYNLYFHPLAGFPGPFLWRATRLPYMRAAWSGRFPFTVRSLHQKYGDVVRIAPDELSFAHSAAWDDIYSNRGTRMAFPKSETWHGSPKGAPSSVFSKIDLKEHARARRAMDPGFSERAVARQEFIVQEYMDLFLQRIRERISANDGESTTLNIIEWFNFITFDIIGDLAFGESFHCLETVQCHEWMSFMFGSIKANYLTISLRHYPLLFKYLMKLIPQSVKQKQQKHWGLAAEKVTKRLNSKIDRPDIISLLEGPSDNGREGLSVGEIHANASIFIIAGSETTVTVLTGITNYLLQNPTTLTQLEEEIRGKFSDAKEISFAALKKLPYLNAVIKEGLRMCNPNPIGHVRISPPQGGTVAGHIVPGQTFVTIHPATLMFSDKHFHKPHAWCPERWLEEAQTSPTSPFYSDDRKSVRAFGHGPQACIGEPLAWAEMRLILAKSIWAFDFKQADTPHSRVVWEDQDVFGVIDKHPLDVKLSFRG